MFETQNVSVPKWLLLVLIIVMITLIASVYYYYLDPQDAKLVGLIGGIISGGLVFLLTYLASVQPLKDLARYEQMGVRGLLASRHDRAYYTKLLSKARRSVRVMGASCTRFVEDFLDPQSEDHELLEALRRNQTLYIQLLIPDDEHITENAKARLPGLFQKLDVLKSTHGKRIELRRFPSQGSTQLCERRRRSSRRSYFSRRRK